MSVRFERARLLCPDLTEETRARRQRGLALVEEAIEAVDPARSTTRVLAELGLDQPVTVLAFGKAATPMCRAALDAVEVEGGIAVVLAPTDLGPLEVRRGAHPVPAEDAEQTARAVLRYADALGAGSAALCLVSGGGSSMLELPRDGVSLGELSASIARLGRAGAAIDELNAVRRALSSLKGGGLARAIAPARVINVIVSDVPGLPPEVVASGPTCAPPAGPDPVEVARRYGLWPDLTDAARRWLSAPVERLEAEITSYVAADNDAARRATGLPDRGLLLAGEARELGARLASEERSAPWVAGGETTVTLLGDGRGGRSLELALGAIAAGWRGGLLVAVGTDGIDGNSDLAGALVDDAVVSEMSRLGLDPLAFLERSDAAAFFDQVGAGLRCGPTGTNVADLALMLP